MAREQDPRSPRAAAQAALTLPAGQPSPLAAPTAAPAVAGGAAGNVDIGTHQYAVTFTKAGQESELGPVVPLTISASAKHGSLTAVPLGPTGTTGRNIYRTVAANTTDFRLVGSIADNSTTVFDDNIADATLNAAVAVPVGGQPEADSYQEIGRRGATSGL
jgi:hypothetical protein